MSYLEKNFQTDYNKYCKHLHRKTGAFELKLTKGISIPFNAVVEHQVNALYNTKHDCVVVKVPDCGFQNGYDSYMMCFEPAWVVLMFRAKQKEFVMIDIDDWIKEKETSERKSITEERAYQIGTVCSLKERSQG